MNMGETHAAQLYHDNALLLVVVSNGAPKTPSQSSMPCSSLFTRRLSRRSPSLADWRARDSSTRGTSLPTFTSSVRRPRADDQVVSLTNGPALVLPDADLHRSDGAHLQGEGGPAPPPRRPPNQQRASSLLEVLARGCRRLRQRRWRDGDTPRPASSWRRGPM